MKSAATVRRGKTAAPDGAPGRIWLIRHAHALDADVDALRRLSKRGRRQVRALARCLGAHDGFQPAEIWHSPLVRARQTAELLTRHLAFDGSPVRVADIKPGDAPRTVARRLKTLRHSVALVGHEPHLSALASLLVAGQATPALFVLKKCAALALERGAGRWVVRWLVSPEILP